VIDDDIQDVSAHADNSFQFLRDILRFVAYSENPVDQFGALMKNISLRCRRYRDPSLAQQGDILYDSLSANGKGFSQSGSAEGPSGCRKKLYQFLQAFGSLQLCTSVYLLVADTSRYDSKCIDPFSVHFKRSGKGRNVIWPVFSLDEKKFRVTAHHLSR
jgi:hypothetical protein